ncbi:MAG TPA: nucleoside-diphosphate sugar epimerase/dehydratase [Pyrinomonadaceae bacterium]|nr:nucleoside-diphosphate sugar epimerase/dehydratase [Pyrinomonadaceae bacterium]
MNEQNQLTDRFWFLRRPVQFLADIAVLCGAFFVAYLPAVNVQLSDFYLEIAVRQLPFVVLVQFSSIFLVGAYSILWRYVSIEDLKVFLKAAMISGGVLLVLRFALTFTDFTLWQVPLSVILIDTTLAFGGLLALRVVRRFFYEFGEKNKVFGASKPRLKRKPALLVGAGRLGASLVKELSGRRDAELEVRGLVDDDPRKKGGSVSGYKVLGTTKELPRFVDELNVGEVVIALDRATGKEIRRIIDVCSAIPVKARIVPSLNEIASGRVSISRIRDVQIEDLLGRDPVQLDDDHLHEFLTGRTVMVTGAGGSIGSELVRQIITYRPKCILLVERAEFFLFQIGRELQDIGDIQFVPLIADVGDEARMREIFDRYRPEVIFHAAAHKHVPLMEVNAVEAIKNNVLATRCLGELAGEFAVRDFVLISTDKAVNPTSVMGASKRVAEIVVQGLNRQYATNYVAVRFGNVLGSAGSVVPIFHEQIRRGEAITVTDPEMTRYFMTIPEASQLVLQAGALGSGGEIFILDMGEPVKIVNLAEDMIRLSGLTPYEDIDIVFTGVRRGEKLFEELEITGENLDKTNHPKIFIGKIGGYSNDDVELIVNSFKAAVVDCDEARIRQLFNKFLPEARIDNEAKTTPPQEVERNDDSFFTQKASQLGLAEK